jgi:hypothetical protein
MSKNRTGLYLGLAVAGAGGYYLYRAGGDVRGAKKEMKCMSSNSVVCSMIYVLCRMNVLTNMLRSVDAEKAREKLPTGRDAEQKGAEVGKEAGAQVDEAVWSIPFLFIICSFPICFLLASWWHDYHVHVSRS